MSDDDGMSINIRRSSGAGSFQPTLASSAKRLPPGKKRDAAIKEKKSLKKALPAADKVKLPRPTAETFGDDFSGLGKSKGAAAKKHGDGGVTLAAAAAGHGSKPWERKPKAANVRKVEPEVATGSTDKNMARVRYGKAGAANRHDTSTFSVSSFGDEALKLLPALVENLQHKFGASNMTHVQKGSIPAILQGADVLLRARTGTGKTLAYLVPIVQYLANRDERIPREQGTHALVVVPTRELAVQVHDVLTNMLRPFHWLVPGIIMGGEKKKSEKARIRKGLHVITGTPGRLTDHMSSTECLNVHPIQFLVLDEADRLMDLGFEKDIAKICNFVKTKRDDFLRARLQTILVSATLDDKVKELAFTTLSNPLLVSDDSSKKNAQGVIGLDDEATGEEADANSGDPNQKFSLPTRLRQYWMPVQCKRRLLSLCAFLRQRSVPSSRPCKAIIFVASVAEVKFLHYVLARAALPDTWRSDGGDAAPERDSDDEDEEDNPALLSLPVSALHGDMVQGDRTSTFLSFLSADRGVLVCTDVAARGLDFPKVDWIIQYDPPTDVEEYVHRCGRTARMTCEGDALLFLMPHEEQYVQVLQKHSLRLTPLPAASLLSVVKGGGKPKEKHGSAEYDQDFLGMQRALEDIVSTDPDASDFARAAYTSFMRAYATHPRATKHIFHTKALHFGHVASSFALREPPKRIKDEMVKRVRERDEKFKGRAASNNPRDAASKRKAQPQDERKERAEFVKKRRQIGYDADAKIGLSAV